MLVWKAWERWSCPSLMYRWTHMWFLSSVQFSRSVMSNSLRPHGLQHARPPCRHQLPELTQTHLHWVGDAIQPSHPLSSPSPLFNLSQHQGLFKWISSSIIWLKYWSFSFSISPSTEYSALISFRLDLPAVQGTLKSLLQHHSSKASILRCSAFFIVQLSHPDAVIRELLGSGAVKGKHGPLFRTCIQMQAFTLTPEQSRMLPNGS